MKEKNKKQNRMYAIWLFLFSSFFNLIFFSSLLCWCYWCSTKERREIENMKNKTTKLSIRRIFLLHIHHLVSFTRSQYLLTHHWNICLSLVHSLIFAVLGECADSLSLTFSDYSYNRINTYTYTHTHREREGERNIYMNSFLSSYTIFFFCCYFLYAIIMIMTIVWALLYGLCDGWFEHCLCETFDRDKLFGSCLW